MTARTYRKQFTVAEWRLLARSREFLFLVRRRQYEEASGFATVLFAEAFLFAPRSF